MESRKAAALVWIIVILLSCACAISDGVRKFAEPVDRGGCRFDCKLARLEFSRYEYRQHRCFCLNADGNEMELYGLDLEEISR